MPTDWPAAALRDTYQHVFEQCALHGISEDTAWHAVSVANALEESPHDVASRLLREKRARAQLKAQPPSTAAAASSTGCIFYETLKCPINHEVFDDPVIAADGHTYERVAIEQWFATRVLNRELASLNGNHVRSPMTGQPFANKTLLPNHIVKSAVAAYKEQRRPLPLTEFNPRLLPLPCYPLTGRHPLNPTCSMNDLASANECTRLHPLHLTAPHCTRLHLIAPDCT
jgi:hypothetical protein